MNRMLILPLLLALLICGPGASAEGTFNEDMPVIVDEPLVWLPDVEADLAETASVEADSAGTDPVGTEPAEADSAEVTDAEALVHVQEQLKTLGLLNSRADGIFGPKTAAALRAFQSANDLDVTGMPNAATSAKLEAAVANATRAREVQARLHELGYLREQADGIFGERSEAALKQFQQLNELQATGIADAETLERLFSDDVIQLPAGLRSGDKGDAVTALQERLIRFGFTDANADGAYGKKTLAAVKAFQQHLIDQGLAQAFDITVTGEATAITQFFLLSDGYSSYLRDIEPGDTDGEALRIERRLKALGYLDATPDDTLDDYAVEALKQFRASAGLSSGGTINRAVVDALFSADASVADHCVPHDIALNDQGLAVEALEEALITCGMTVKPSSGKYNRDVADAVDRVHAWMIAMGDPRAELFANPEALTVEAQEALLDDLPGYRSDVDETADPTEISRVQRRLNTLYYLDRTAVDGAFGEKTLQALHAFQADHGLQERDIADEAAQALLFSKATAPKQLPYRVEVSLARQRVEVYIRQDDGSYLLDRTFTCSTGLGGTTPRGVFVNGFPVNRWHYFQKFNCWAQYSFDIEGDIMFHSVIYSSNSESTLRENSLYALGSPASHGCIRLRVADARWLFEHCSKGSLVIIIR